MSTATTYLAPEATTDGYMEVETFSPGVRGSFEKIRCSSFTGIAEYASELRRVILLRIAARKSGEDWQPVVVRLVYGDFEHQRMEIV